MSDNSTRKSSDLQRLVEENEGDEEDDENKDGDGGKRRKSSDSSDEDKIVSLHTELIEPGDYPGQAFRLA